MTHEKPDLSQIPPQIRDYIEALEAEIERLRPTRSRRSPARFDDGELDNLDLSELLEPAEEQTTINVITATGNGFAKRTPRHLYSRQRRGGMGVFDLDTSEDNPPAILTLADETQNLLLLTNLGRAFRLPVAHIEETPVRGARSKYHRQAKFGRRRTAGSHFTRTGARLPCPRQPIRYGAPVATSYFWRFDAARHIDI